MTSACVTCSTFISFTSRSSSSNCSPHLSAGEPNTRVKDMQVQVKIKSLPKYKSHFKIYIIL